MTDKISKHRRSLNMQKIKSKDTKPELQIRKLLSKLGYRYRLHAKKLPGKPDIVFNKLKKVLFVHGCFWHQHKNGHCQKYHYPKTRLSFWKKKLTDNIKRDIRNQIELKKAGWESFVIWECEIPGYCRKPKRIVDYIKRT